MTTTAIVTLRRNGARVHQGAVLSISIAVNRLLAEGYAIAVYELVQLARNPQHELFGNAGDVLERYGLLESGRLHDVTRDVVDAMFDDDGLTMVGTVAA